MSEQFLEWICFNKGKCASSGICGIATNKKKKHHYIGNIVCLRFYHPYFFFYYVLLDVFET